MCLFTMQICDDNVICSQIFYYQIINNISDVITISKHSAFSVLKGL